MGLKSGLTKPTFVLLSTMEELVTLIKNIVATEEVVVLDVTGDGVSSPLKVVIDSEIPVDLSIVTRVTRLIKNAAEMEQQFPDGFRLEVGSAGIDAPLQHPFQYRKNINRDMRIKLLENQVEYVLFECPTAIYQGSLFLSVVFRASGYRVTLSVKYIILHP